MQPLGGCMHITDYRLLQESETVNRLRPLARRRLSTSRPFFVDIRWRKPCLLKRFVKLG